MKMTEEVILKNCSKPQYEEENQIELTTFAYLQPMVPSDEQQNSCHLQNIDSSDSDEFEEKKIITTKRASQYEHPFDTQERSMTYDDVVEKLGEFGRYQHRIYFLLCLPAIACAFHKLVNVFTQANVLHRCKLPWEDSNASYYLPQELLKFYPRDDFSNEYSSCEIYKFSSANEINFNETIRCNSWIYDRTTYETTTLIQWNLVCDRAGLKATSDAIYMVGDLLGAIVFGFLSDRIGRKITFFIALVLQSFAGLCIAFAPNYTIFLISRMLSGSAGPGVYLPAYVIALEMVGTKKRVVAGVVTQMFFTVGYILTGVLAYYIRDWQYLQITVSLPGLIFLSYWWFIPESARWLITKGRQEEAEVILMNAAKENKVDISKEALRSLLEIGKSGKEDTSQNQSSFVDLFKTPTLLRISLVIFFIWFVNGHTYYGLSWSTGDLVGNDYVNFIISGLVEFPAYIFLLMTLNRWGRKLILCVTMMVAGLALLSNIFVPIGMKWIITLFAMTGKLAITASYGTVYIYSAEQFPTVIRNAGMAASLIFSRLGGIFAPYVNVLVTPLPLIVFGSLSLAAVLLALSLPEVHNGKLPDTIEDTKHINRPDKQKLNKSFSPK